MQGAPKRQLNAEEMLAELKQALESSTRAPNAARPSASTAPKSSSPGRETRRSQMDGESDRPVRAKANSPVGQPNDLQKSTRPSSRRWTLTAGAIALTVAATIGVSFALMNKAQDSAEREPSVTATESLARPQNEQTLKPSSDSRLLMEDSQKLAPSQAGNLETRPEGGTAPANSGLAPAGGNGELDASHLASFGLESAPPAFAPVPPSTPAILEPSQVIRPDGTPIATAPSTPASTASAPPPAQTPKPAVPSSAPQMVKPDRAPIAARAPSRFDRLSAASGRDAEAGGPVGRPANGEVECGANCDSAAHSRFDRLSAVSGRDAKAEGQADSVCVERICGALDAEDRFKEEAARETIPAKASQERKSISKISGSG